MVQDNIIDLRRKLGSLNINQLDIEDCVELEKTITDAVSDIEQTIATLEIIKNQLQEKKEEILIEREKSNSSNDN